ncbi:MAG TPA: hypothetical protein VGF94_02110 [Kofleriaceae bacterium]
MAIIDLSADPDARLLRQQLYNALVDHWALRPMDTEAFNAALQGDFVDEDAEDLARAQTKSGEVTDDLSRLDFQPAANAADDALHALTTVTPAAAALSSADFAFLSGVAELELHHDKEAAAYFAFAHRLNPSYAVDPVRYLPEIVEAYQRAAAAHLSPVKLAVIGAGDLWVDGVDRGAAGPVDVAAGWHLVQLTGQDLVTIGQLVDVESARSLEIDAKPASDELRVKRARRALAQLPDDAVARAGAMTQLAELLGVHDAVLIWKDRTKLVVQTWRDREPGFSALRVRGREPVRDLLAPLAPPEPPHVAQPIQILPPVRHVEDEPPWYRRRWVQATVAGGVAVTVAGALLYAARHQIVMTNPMPGGFPR